MACTSENSIIEFSENGTMLPDDPVIYVMNTSMETLDLAKKIAYDFSSQTTIPKTKNKENRIVKEMLTIEDDNGAPAMYVFNYQNDEGFLITSATQDYMPILAFSDKGNFDVNGVEGKSVEIWIQNEKMNIAAVKNANDSIKAMYHAQWIPYSATPVSLSQLITTKGSYDEVRDFILSESATWISQGYQPIALGSFKSQHFSYYVDNTNMNIITNECESHGTPEYGGWNVTCFVLVKQSDNVSLVNSLGTPEWDQGPGFNTYIPNYYPVGCVPVAVGEIMKYWQYPASFNWNQITNEASDATAQFLYQVALACNTTFGPGGSGATPQDALNAFHSYGYANASLVSHNDGTVKTNLNTGKPVYMRGRTTDNLEGHAWVCDGYRQVRPGYEIVVKALQTKTSFYTQNMGVYYSTITPAIYYYINWGYSGKQNGFYLSTGMNITEGQFNSSRLNIINIYH